MGGGRSVEESLRGFVVAVLQRGLAWPPWRAPLDVADEIRRKGRVRVAAEGSDGTGVLPFEINIQARVGSDTSIARLEECFSCAVKFGEGRGKACVTRFDGAHGLGWHVHQFDPETGLVARFDRRHAVGAIRLYNIEDALGFSLEMFTDAAGLWRKHDQVELRNYPRDIARAVPLVVRHGKTAGR